jgi:PKD repeat protein
VAWYDGYESPFPTNFFAGQLAPDGRIYITASNGSDIFHVIHRPDEPGAASLVEQHGIRLPTYNASSIPVFPNFRLGPVDGSACDTLGINNLPLAGWRYDRTGGLGVDFTSVSWYEPTAWAWEFGDPTTGTNNFSTEKHPSHTFSAPGGYDVCLTVSNTNGSDTKCKTVWVNTVSAQEPGEEVSVKVYPNPTTGELRWEGAEKAVTVRVYNVLGQLQLEGEAAEGHIDLSDLSTGLYAVQFLDASGGLVAVRKVQRF